MKLVTPMILSLSLLSLSACATIVEGSSDNINISTIPPVNASCTLSNSRGNYSTYTPAAAIVKKSKSDLDVSCIDPRSGAKGQSKMISSIEPWAFGNILIGGLIGLGIDWGTGATYDYPEQTTISLIAPISPIATESMPPVAAPLATPQTLPVTTVAPSVTTAPIVQPYAAPVAQPTYATPATTYVAPVPFGAPTPPAGQ